MEEGTKDTLKAIGLVVLSIGALYTIAYLGAEHQAKQKENEKNNLKK